MWGCSMCHLGILDNIIMEYLIISYVYEKYREMLCGRAAICTSFMVYNVLIII